MKDENGIKLCFEYSYEYNTKNNETNQSVLFIIFNGFKKY